MFTTNTAGSDAPTLDAIFGPGTDSQAQAVAQAVANNQAGVLHGGVSSGNGTYQGGTPEYAGSTPDVTAAGLLANGYTYTPTGNPYGIMGYYNPPATQVQTPQQQSPTSVNYTQNVKNVALPNAPLQTFTQPNMPGPSPLNVLPAAAQQPTFAPLNSPHFGNGIPGSSAGIGGYNPNLAAIGNGLQGSNAPSLLGQGGYGGNNGQNVQNGGLPNLPSLAAANAGTQVNLPPGAGPVQNLQRQPGPPSIGNSGPMNPGAQVPAQNTGDQQGGESAPPQPQPGQPPRMQAMTPLYGGATDTSIQPQQRKPLQGGASDVGSTGYDWEPMPHFGNGKLRQVPADTPPAVRDVLRGTREEFSLDEIRKMSDAWRRAQPRHEDQIKKQRQDDHQNALGNLMQKLGGDYGSNTKPSPQDQQNAGDQSSGAQQMPPTAPAAPPRGQQGLDSLYSGYNTPQERQDFRRRNLYNRVLQDQNSPPAYRAQAQAALNQMNAQQFNAPKNQQLDQIQKNLSQPYNPPTSQQMPFTAPPLPPVQSPPLAPPIQPYATPQQIAPPPSPQQEDLDPQFKAVDDKYQQALQRIHSSPGGSPNNPSQQTQDAYKAMIGAEDRYNKLDSMNLPPDTKKSTQLPEQIQKVKDKAKEMGDNARAPLYDDVFNKFQQATVSRQFPPTQQNPQGGINGRWLMGALQSGALADHIADLKQRINDAEGNNPSLPKIAPSGWDESNNSERPIPAPISPQALAGLKDAMLTAQQMNRMAVSLKGRIDDIKKDNPDPSDGDAIDEMAKEALGPQRATLFPPKNNPIAAALQLPRTQGGLKNILLHPGQAAQEFKSRDRVDPWTPTRVALAEAYEAERKEMRGDYMAASAQADKAFTQNQAMNKDYREGVKAQRDAAKEEWEMAKTRFGEAQKIDTASTKQQEDAALKDKQDEVNRLKAKGTSGHQAAQTQLGYDRVAQNAKDRAAARAQRDQEFHEHAQQNNMQFFQKLSEAKNQNQLNNARKDAALEVSRQSKLGMSLIQQMKANTQAMNGARLDEKLRLQEENHELDMKCKEAMLFVHQVYAVDRSIATIDRTGSLFIRWYNTFHGGNAGHGAAPAPAQGGGGPNLGAALGGGITGYMAGGPQGAVMGAAGGLMQPQQHP